MTYTSDDASAYIASVPWQFASTMPRIPHWYTIRKWRPDLDSAFLDFVRLYPVRWEQDERAGPSGQAALSQPVPLTRRLEVLDNGRPEPRGRPAGRDTRNHHPNQPCTHRA